MGYLRTPQQARSLGFLVRREAAKSEVGGGP